MSTLRFDVCVLKKTKQQKAFWLCKVFQEEKQIDQLSGSSNQDELDDVLFDAIMECHKQYASKEMLGDNTSIQVRTLQTAVRSASEKTRVFLELLSRITGGNLPVFECVSKKNFAGLLNEAKTLRDQAAAKKRPQVMDVMRKEGGFKAIYPRIVTLTVSGVVKKKQQGAFGCVVRINEQVTEELYGLEKAVKNSPQRMSCKAMLHGLEWCLAQYPEGHIVVRIETCQEELCKWNCSSQALAESWEKVKELAARFDRVELCKAEKKYQYLQQAKACCQKAFQECKEKILNAQKRHLHVAVQADENGRFPAGWAACLYSLDKEIKPVFFSGSLPAATMKEALIFGMTEALKNINSDVSITIVHGNEMNDIETFLVDCSCWKKRKWQVEDMPKDVAAEYLARLHSFAERLKLSFRLDVPPMPVNAMCSQNARQRYQEECAEVEKPLITIYTDGSAGKHNAGGWAFCIQKDGEENLWQSGGANNVSSSSQMEEKAILSALEVVEEPARIMLFSDCLSAFDMLKKDASVQQKMEQGFRICPVWIPGHCNLKNHDACDELAGQTRAIFENLKKSE